jgi:ribulose 1,5-bisphosphate carboxylase large subunit-like protein
MTDDEMSIESSNKALEHAQGHEPGARLRRYDRAWDAILAAPELAEARRKLSIHELRLIIQAALTGSVKL